MITFVVKGVTYRTARKLNAFEQFHVCRRLTPFVGDLFYLRSLSSPEKTLPIEAIVAPLADSIAKLNDADCDYVLQTCASVVEREEGGGKWIAVWNMSAKRFQYDTIDMMDLINMALNVLKENLASFLPEILELVSSLQEPLDTNPSG